ncbi:MAG: DUF3180 domain-containing protein [Demequinaceae bacterium]|nr:DUF3180 domain-containing protein [Demequinaceae bacterium]
MARLTWRRIGAVMLGLGILSWGVNLLISEKGSPLPVPWTVPLSLMIAAGAALWLGWEVRQYRSGKRPGLSPFQAVRTALFAQAAALTGAALMGVYGGYAMALAGYWSHPPRRAFIEAAILATIASGLLLAAGWIAERWCAIDDDDDDDEFIEISPEAA